MDSHDAPRSRLRNRYVRKSPILWLSATTNTVSGSCWDASTSLTKERAGSSGSAAVRLQFAPPSVLTWTSPSSLPVKSTPSATGDSEIAVSVA